jgi:hypothetical protein
LPNQIQTIHALRLKVPIPNLVEQTEHRPDGLCLLPIRHNQPAICSKQHTRKATLKRPAPAVVAYHPQARLFVLEKIPNRDRPAYWFNQIVADITSIFPVAAVTLYR